MPAKWNALAVHDAMKEIADTATELEPILERMRHALDMARALPNLPQYLSYPLRGMDQELQCVVHRIRNRTMSLIRQIPAAMIADRLRIRELERRLAELYEAGAGTDPDAPSDAEDADDDQDRLDTLVSELPTLEGDL